MRGAVEGGCTTHRRVALLFNPVTAPPLKFYMTSIQTAASSFGIEVSVNSVHAKEEIEGVIAAQARNPHGGLIALPDAFNATNHELIISLAHATAYRRSMAIISHNQAA